MQGGAGCAAVHRKYLLLDIHLFRSDICNVTRVELVLLLLALLLKARTKYKVMSLKKKVM